MANGSLESWAEQSLAVTVTRDTGAGTVTVAACSTHDYQTGLTLVRSADLRDGRVGDPAGEF